MSAAARHAAAFGLLISLLLAPPPAAAAGGGKPVPVWGYRVVNSYPHDPGAFTEGLFWKAGYLYESTGLVGRSTVRQVRLETGQAVQTVKLPAELFGEGIVDCGDRLIGVTWQTQLGFVLNLKSFAFERRFDYPGEGWGLTRNARELVMSDGSAELRFLDPETLRERRRLRVTAAGVPVTQLNELEWVEGEIFANVWQTDRIARIDPASGRVTGWIDLSGLLAVAAGGPRVAPAAAAVPTDVLNGIAYDADARRLFVTGKLWPRLFEIRLVAPKPPSGHGEASARK